MMTAQIGQKAPDFTTAAVMPNGEINQNFSFAQATKGKYALIFFYPLDFTFVCPSELIALNNRMDTFKQMGVEVMVVSVDSAFTHLAWRQTPVNSGGVGTLDYPMVSDVSHKICQAYGVQHEELGVAYRACFVIDKQGLVQTLTIHNLPIGRNVDEIIRLFEALEFHEKSGEVCPANWNKGKPGMTPTADGVSSYLQENAEAL